MVDFIMCEHTVLRAKKIKDKCAGAVCIVSQLSVVSGIYVLSPPLLALCRSVSMCSVYSLAALAARVNAYVPYSHLSVGAAVRVGVRIFSGANIENASTGQCNVAERSAILSAECAGTTQ